MRRHLGIAAALLLGAGCVGADAQVTWKNVQIGGRSDFTVDMPAKVDPETNLTGNQKLAFLATLGGDDDVICMLSLQPYNADVTREKAIAGAGSRRRDVFCGDADDGLKDYDIIESKVAVNSGYPAGICAAIFIDPKEKKPATVSADLVVAADAGMYVLGCDINAADRDDLTVDWVDDLADFVHHMQDSLKLPAS